MQWRKARFTLDDAFVERQLQAVDAGGADHDVEQSVTIYIPKGRGVRIEIHVILDLQHDRRAVVEEAWIVRIRLAEPDDDGAVVRRHDIDAELAIELPDREAACLVEAGL